MPWGKILAILLCAGLITAGAVMVDIENKKTTGQDCDKKVIGTSLVTTGTVGLFFAIVLMIYNHILDNRNKTLKYCNTGFDVLQTQRNLGTLPSLP